jgi:hypothetical protein
MRTTLWITGAVLVTCAATLGCSRKVVYRDRPDVVVVKSEPVIVQPHPGGPPPHAPAHGYRRKHGGDNVVLVYDRRLQVYVVQSHPGCYYSAGQFFRFGANTWEWSVDIGGTWHGVKSDSDLPTGLRTMKVAHKEDRKKKKGKD